MEFILQERRFWVWCLWREASKRHQCIVDTCTLEVDRRLINTSAVVVFKSISGSRKLQSIVCLLSPHYTSGNSICYRKFFNVTMTYRRDSDIPVPIGSYITRSDVTHSEYTLRYRLAKKSGDVVWLVSHCITSLSKHINVDIYGKCGKYSCSKHFDCMERFERKYKLHLGFVKNTSLKNTMLP